MPRSSPREIGHLLRRAGFGATPEELEAHLALGFERSVEKLVAGLALAAPSDPPGFDPYQPWAIQSAWLERMGSSPAPLAEKLALFWHGHFATSIRKVEDPAMMWRQLGVFRSLGGGKFPALVEAVSRDAAMIRWLDGNSNRKGAPNENYARELMELFTLGRGNYTEADVREAARAFTGWGAENGRFAFRAEYHDSGRKTVLGRTGDLDGIDVVAAVTDRPECAAFVSAKLLRFFSHEDPTKAEVSAAANLFARSRGDVAAAVRHVLLAPAFRSERSYRALVKSPAEFAVGAVKGAGLGAVPAWVPESLGRMGQALFAPPTVKGWDGGPAWLGAGALLERMRFADRLARESGATLAGAEAVSFDGGALAPDLARLVAAATPVDRFALLVASPEYQLN